MRVHEEPSNSPAIYLAAAGVAAACAAILRPYDVDAAVERVYAVLKKTHVCTEDEYEASCPTIHTATRRCDSRARAKPQTSNWVCIPVSMEVSNQFVDIGELINSVGSGCTVVAQAVTDNPNRRSKCKSNPPPSTFPAP